MMPCSKSDASTVPFKVSVDVIRTLYRLIMHPQSSSALVHKFYMDLLRLCLGRAFLGLLGTHLLGKSSFLSTPIHTLHYYFVLFPILFLLRCSPVVSTDSTPTQYLSKCVPVF